MKTLLASLLFAGLLCGSMFASDTTPFQSAKASIRADLTKKKETLYAKITKQGTVPREEFSFLQILGHAADPKSEWHAKALKAIRVNASFAQTLTKARADVVALPATAETRTFVAQVLDPVIKGLAAPANDAFIDDLARLVAALK